ncbi:myosin light chain kinase, smooth muscle-like isoform X2 [Clytia hemisphaerica]|uniref:myosin light chain kinase, smooth muscle-like isoform X2 n=1 Tax=Clytia hemisphaerica TaxID=252671 RepID=UPI0034D578E4
MADLVSLYCRVQDPPAVRIKKSRSFELDRKAEVMINKDQTFESKYELLEELGKGMFGTVKKCQCTDTGVEYAAKVVRKTTKNKEEVVREVSTMNLLQHKSIAQIHDAFESKRQMVIVMELIRGKELFEKVCQEDTLLTEKQCVYYLRQILSGVEYMHKKKIVHLDLKPENILCIDSPQGYDEIKLIDFGLARDLSSTKQLSCICGTPEFVAPEVINFDPISVQSDMWSLGVITYVLLSGISPFLGDDDGETLQNVTFGEFDFEDEDGAFEHVSEIAKEFISDLLCLNPRDRLSVGDCLEHSWLNTQTNEEELDTTNLKKFIARRRWLRTIHAIKAVGRFNQVANSLGGKGKKGGDSLAKTMLAALNAANKENSIDKGR